MGDSVPRNFSLKTCGVACKRLRCFVVDDVGMCDDRMSAQIVPTAKMKVTATHLLGLLLQALRSIASRFARLI